MSGASGGPRPTCTREELLTRAGAGGAHLADLQALPRPAEDGP